MSEIFILYRDVKVTAQYVEQSYNLFWENSTIMSKYAISITNIHTGRNHIDNWYRNSELNQALTQQEIASALQDIMSDASYADNSWEGYCADLELDQDSLRVRATFDHMQEGKDKLLWVDDSFDFGADVEFLDNAIAIYENRVYLKDSNLWSRPSEAIVLFDDIEYEATWEEDRAHPGGPSTARMGDGWVDIEHRMPIDDAWWTWAYSTEPVQERYNMAVPEIQLIDNSTSEDDDYYATL